MRTLSDRETPQPLKSLLTHSKYFFMGKLPVFRSVKLIIILPSTKLQRINLQKSLSQ